MPGILVHDVVIVGAGPAGLSAALMLGRCCRRVVVIDAGEPRNQAARAIHGFLSRDGTSPQELLGAARAELAQYGVALHDDMAVAAAAVPQGPGQPFPTAFQVETRSGCRYQGRKVLFATGVRDEVPDFPGVRDCYGMTVHHCPYCDGWEHRGKRLVAFSEDASRAVKLGLLLREWSADVVVITHGHPPDSDELVLLTRNEILLCQQCLVRILHDEQQVRQIELAVGNPIAADALFFSAGQMAGCELPQSLGCHLVERRTAETDRKHKTNVPGVYLAGDADGDVQFVIVAAAEGATAATAINRELHEEDRAKLKSGCT